MISVFLPNFFVKIRRKSSVMAISKRALNRDIWAVAVLTSVLSFEFMWAVKKNPSNVLVERKKDFLMLRRKKYKKRKSEKYLKSQ